jgi:hypothetical protein
MGCAKIIDKRSNDRLGFNKQPDAPTNQGLAYLNNSETGTINIEKKAKTNDVFNRIAHI